jgi:hypothetical protein
MKTVKHATAPAIAAACLIAAVAAPAADLPVVGGNRLGGGLHYWRNMESGGLGTSISDGAAWVLSYQFRPAKLLTLQPDLELYPRHFIASGDRVYAPQAFLLVGMGLYGGLGGGLLLSGGRTAEQPFYAARAGLDIEVLPATFLDLNLNYRGSRWSDIGNMFDKFTTSAVSAGIALRYGL